MIIVFVTVKLLKKLLSLQCTFPKGKALLHTIILLWFFQVQFFAYNSSSINIYWKAFYWVPHKLHIGAYCIVADNDQKQSNPIIQ